MTNKISIALIFCCLFSGTCSTEKVARLQLYVQDIKAGPNKTVWDVARSNITCHSATDFGLVRVMDNKITAGPDYDSEEVGRAQAIIAFTDMQETAITMNFNFYLKTGKYSGSTLSVVGRQSLSLNEVNREMPIVGGTGVFRMARGYAICNTYLNKDTYIVLEYTLYVFYHDVNLDHVIA